MTLLQRPSPLLKLLHRGELLRYAHSWRHKTRKGANIAYEEKQLVGFSAAQIFDVVYKVEDYPQFVPWCKKADIHKRTDRVLEAELFIGFPPIQEQYKSRVTSVYPSVIKSVCTDGRLFRLFDTTWRFGPPPEGSPSQSCVLHFSIDFEFKSSLYANVTTLFFGHVANTMVSAFLKRAEALNGPPSIRPMKIDIN